MTIPEGGMTLTDLTTKIIVKRTTVRARLSDLKSIDYAISENNKWFLTGIARQFLSNNDMSAKLPVEKKK
jgi:hypothetical protein